MGLYLNLGNSLYKETYNTDTFVDHSMLLKYTNSLIGTYDCFISVTRPRRFGKSTDVNMLCAYYSKGCNSRDIFDHLKITESDTYEEHLNRHNVIHLNMQHFLSSSESVQAMIQRIEKRIKKDRSFQSVG